MKTSTRPSTRRRRRLIRTILVPVDFSDCSSAGLAYAVRFAKEVGARILVLHVTDLGPVMMTTACGDYNSPTYLEAAGHRCGDQMKDFLRHVDFDGVPVDTSTVAGYCPGAIHDVAAKEGADLIVIATHGRTGLRRALIGSIAEGTVRHAICPVLVVPSLASARRSGLRESTRRSSPRIAKKSSTQPRLRKQQSRSFA
jgi:nucleotide-binding universal stress UspA family protein